MLHSNSLAWRCGGTCMAMTWATFDVVQRFMATLHFARIHHGNWTLV
jgi:hypothetical protein